MTIREINSRIYLSGMKPNGYTVHHDIDGEAIICEVPSVAIGNTIVKALRLRAYHAPKPGEAVKLSGLFLAN